MKRTLGTLLLFLGIIAALVGHASADLYVVKAGTGEAALSNASAATFVQKFSDSGTLITTIPMPTEVSGAHYPLTLSGTATSEGFLTLSTNGQYLTLAGYGAAPGVSAVPTTDPLFNEDTNPNPTRRVIGRIDIGTGAVDTTTALTDAYRGQTTPTSQNSPMRSVVSTDGTEFWTGGTGFTGTNDSTHGGVRYATFGSDVTTRVSPNFPYPSNIRVVNIFDGQLYMSSNTGAYVGISKVGTGLTTEELTAIPEILPGMEDGMGRSSYDFWFKDASTLYVADDRFLDNGGGIQKWVYNSEAFIWNLAYTLNDSSATSGLRGLAGTIVNGETVLYATTAQTNANRIMTVTDTGASSVFTQLAQAPANTVFRGVEFVFTESAGLAGDYNSDGFVDAADYTVWRNNLGGAADAFPNRDPGNAANPINSADYQFWKDNYGTGGPGSGGLAGLAPVPEPASFALVLLGLAGLWCSRRR